MNKKMLSLFFLVHSFLSCFAGFEMGKQNTLRIPFKLIGNLIVIQVTLNDVPLNFVLDTGVKPTLLFGENSQQLDRSNMQQVQMAGLGAGEGTSALKSLHNRVSIGNNFVDSAHEVFVVFDEDFNFSANLGYEINGVIGYEFFKNHVVAINFDRKHITISKNWKKKDIENMLPLSLEDGRPYAEVHIANQGQAYQAKMLIDLGNTDALWLFADKLPGFRPSMHSMDAYLGQGFSGAIFGKKMRIAEIKMGNFTIPQPIAALPDSNALLNLSSKSDRSGSLGNDLMKRFNMIFDYGNEKVYLSKNKLFEKPFMVNMSGMELRHEGLVWEQGFINLRSDTKDELQMQNKVKANSNRMVQYKYMLKPVFVVSQLLPQSPAALAGVQVGDRLMAIDQLEDAALKINDIYALLSDRPGRKLRLVLKRGDKHLVKHIKLVDPIPLSP